MAGQEPQWGELGPGKNIASAQTHEFDSNTKSNQPLLVREHLVSIYYLPGTLLRTIHKTQKDKSAGWGEKCDQTTVGVGAGSI